MLSKDAARFIDILLSKPSAYVKLIGFTRLGELHDRWIKDMVNGTGDRTLQAHRGSYKTTCVSIALAFLVILRPNEHILFMRKTDSDIKEVIKQVSNILKDPHTAYLVQKIYGVPFKLTTDTATELSTNLCTDIKGTSQLVGTGIGSSLTGKHFDRIFTDDIVNINDRISRAERDRTKLVYQELRNIINRGGRIYNTGTPWHKDDAFSIMPNAERFDCYSTGLISEEELKEIKTQMLPSLFAANYELRHIASEDVIFTSPTTGAPAHFVEQGDYHIDASYGGSDYTAFTMMNYVDGKWYVLGRCWRKHVDDTIPEIIELRKRYNGGRGFCEDNGDKGYLARDLKQRGERIHKYHESTNKFVKITSYLKAAWNNVIFVEGTDEEYISQICDYNEHAEHDDCPDSLASLLRAKWKKKGSTQTGSTEEYTPMWN